MRPSSVFPAFFFLFFLFINGVTARPVWTGQEGPASGKPVAASRQAPVRERLPETGQPLERDLKEGETHVFETNVAAGEFLEVTIEQLGIDASVEIADGLGKPVLKIDTPTAAEERETVGFVAVRAGAYSVTIQPVIQQTSPKAGRYRLTVTARRAATARDRSLDKGLRALSEALAEKDAAKVLARSEAAYEALLPLLGAGHPNVRAAALAYSRKAPRDKWQRAAQLAEPILAVREKDDSARPAEVLNWNGIILRGFAGPADGGGAPCKAQEMLLPLFAREIRLRTRVFGLNSSETTNTLAGIAVFYRRCDPDKVPDFLESAIVEREAQGGDSNPSVLFLTRIYSLTLTNRTIERFTAFINRRTEAVLADPGIGRSAKALILMEAARNRRNMFQGILVDGPAFGKETTPEDSRLAEEVMRTQTREADRLLQQALALMEPEKAKNQARYFECLTEIQRSDSHRLSDLDNQVIAFAESVSKLEVPQLIGELEQIAARLEEKLEPTYKPECPEPAANPAETKEKIRHVYEEIFRLAESQFSTATAGSDASGGARAANAPAQSERPEPGSDERQGPRREIDGVALAYARFLSSGGDAAAAASVLERGLVFRVKHGDDPVPGTVVFAGAFDLMGDEKRAEQLYGEALNLGENAPDEKKRIERLLYCLPAIAQFHERFGRYDQAEKMYRRLGQVADRYKQIPDTDSFEVEEGHLSNSEEGLAWLAAERGDEKAFAERIRTLIRKFPDYSLSPTENPRQLLELKSARRWRQNLLAFYAARYACFGNQDRAMNLINRLAADLDNRPEDRTTLRLVGLMYLRMGRLREAVPWLERAFLIQTEADPVAAIDELRLLLSLLDEQGGNDRAIGLLERLSGKFDPLPGAPEILFVHTQLARFQVLAGRFEDALRTYERLASLGGGDGTFPLPVREQAALELWRAGRMTPAVRHQAEANDLREWLLLGKVLEHIVGRDASEEEDTSSECAKPAAPDRRFDFSGELNRTISLQVLAGPEDVAARRAAFESALRRKGRSLEPLLETAAAKKGAYPKERQELGMAWLELDAYSLDLVQAEDRAASVRQELEGNDGFPDERFTKWCPRGMPFEVLAVEPPIDSESGIGVKTPTFGEEVNQLVTRMIASRPDLRPLLTPITLDAVQKALPADGALVEVARYAPFNPKTGTTEGEERYAVYVLTPQGEPQWFDGGTASEIDRVANLLANEARDYADEESKAATAVLENRFIAPALKLTGNAKRVYVAFDERLASLPLKKLVNAEGKPFGESRGLIFIRGGRELLTMNAPR